jgi:ATP phosphoribosyltransferase regulatory subunit HisZ
VEPSDVEVIVEAHGQLVVGEGGELMVELPDQEAVEALSSALSERFGNQVLLSP